MLVAPAPSQEFLRRCEEGLEIGTGGLRVDIALSQATAWGQAGATPTSVNLLGPSAFGVVAGVSPLLQALPVMCRVGAAAA